MLPWDALGDGGQVDRFRSFQMLFLLHVTLASNRPKIMNTVLDRHRHDELPGAEEDEAFRATPMPVHADTTKVVVRPWKGKVFHPDATMLDALFWNCVEGFATPETADITEDMCLRAAELVAGTAGCNVYDRSTHRDYRVFVLDHNLADSCYASATLVLASPRFLRSLLACWPASGRSWTHKHIRALADSLQHHVDLTHALVRIGETLVTYGGVPVSEAEKQTRPYTPICDQLYDRWKVTAKRGFVTTSFQALCLHLSCTLESSETAMTHSLNGILERVSSRVPVIPATDVSIRSGRLDVADIPNFPLIYRDALAEKDARLIHDGGEVFERMTEALEADAVLSGSAELRVAAKTLTSELPSSVGVPPSIENTSYRRLRQALAKGEHFCFQPNNCEKMAEDGVVFLRGDARTWTVLLVLVEHRDCVPHNFGPILKFPMCHVVQKWRSAVEHLPATVVDTTGETHTLRYARILVTANPIDNVFLTTPMNFDKTNIGAQIERVGNANAAYVKLEDNAAKERREKNIKATSQDASQDHVKANHCPAAYTLEQGPVIGEYHMTIKQIGKWCPTVGMLASNIVHIADLQGEEDQ